MRGKFEKFMVIAIFLFIASTVSAQQNFLKVGDTLPEIVIPNILNHKTISSNTADFRGKLLILDFWGTWCAPCVANIPKMDSLQKEFGDKVQFLPVTDEPLERVKRFADNYLLLNGKKVMTVYNDRTIKKMFNIGALPYYVWIDENGKIIAKTTDKELTVELISQALKKSTKNINSRTDRSTANIDLKKPIFNVSYSEIGSTQSVSTDSNRLSQTTVSNYIPGLKSQTHYDGIHYFSMNTSVANQYTHMYAMLYYGQMTPSILSKGRIRYEITDERKLARLKSDSRGQEYTDFLIKNGTCYELIWPKSTTLNRKQLLNWVKSDLDRNFGDPLKIAVNIEKLLVDSCLVLERIDPKINIKSVAVKNNEEFDRYSYKSSNIPFSIFFERLSGYYLQLSDMPLLDHTGISGNVDLNIKGDLKNISDLNGQLKKYGLRIVIKSAVADVIVFKDL